MNYQTCPKWSPLIIVSNSYSPFELYISRVAKKVKVKILPALLLPRCWSCEKQDFVLFAVPEGSREKHVLLAEMKVGS